MSELVLSKEELVILLNLMGSRIAVDYPFSNDQIFTAETEDKHYKLELHIDDRYSDSGYVLWEKEKPSYSDYRQSFLASNLINYSNLEEFRQEYRTYSNLRTKVVYAPDTNLFYNQFLSTGIINPDETLLVETVQKEITRMLNKKFNPKDLSVLKNSVKYQKNLFDEFHNGRMKPSRLAYNLALQEYRTYSNQVYATAQTGDLHKDKEENDVLFVEAVKEYQKNSNTFPVVLTCDRLLVDICESIGVNYFLFELPRSIQPSDASPEQLCHVLCSLAGVLGVVQVNKIIIFGEFRGKTSYDEYKVRFKSGKVPLELERDLEICRELVKLKIDF